MKEQNLRIDKLKYALVGTIVAGLVVFLMSCFGVYNFYYLAVVGIIWWIYGYVAALVIHHIYIIYKIIKGDYE